jgi:hypothetical protein
MAQAPRHSIEESIALVRLVLEMVDKVRPHGEIEAKTVNAPVLAMFCRAVSLQKAILLLMEKSFIEEAMFLGRSLFEDALRLHQLSAEPTDRGALILGWIESSINEKEGLWRVARSLGLHGDHDANLARVAEERSQLRIFAANNKVQRSKAFLSPKDAALKYGRREDFWSYELAHEMVHGSDAAHAYRRRKNDDGVYLYFANTDAPGPMSGTAAFSARSLVQATRAVAAIMGWGGADEIAAAEDTVEKFEPQCGSH